MTNSVATDSKPHSERSAVFVAIALAAVVFGVVLGSKSVETTSVDSPTWEKDPIVNAIPFRAYGDGMHVYVKLGGVPHDMLVDTGASISSVTEPIARVLIRRKRASVSGQASVALADGSVSAVPVITVYRVDVGPYRLSNVEMLVHPDGAMLLLGLPVLNAIGSFTVDQNSRQIRFND